MQCYNSSIQTRTRSGHAPGGATRLLQFNFWASCPFRSTMSWFTLLLTYCLAFMLLLDSVYKNIRLLSHRATSYHGLWSWKWPWRCNISGHARAVSGDNCQCFSKQNNSFHFSLFIACVVQSGYACNNVKCLPQCFFVDKITPDTLVLKKVLNYILMLIVSVGLWSSSIGRMGGRWDTRGEGGANWHHLSKHPHHTT